VRDFIEAIRSAGSFVTRFVRRLIGLLPVVAACGRIGFDGRSGPSGGDDTTPDAASINAPPRCDPTAEFGVPRAISELNDPASDDGALRLLPDELSGYFWSFRGGVGNIYLATRDTPTSTFALQLVEGLAYTNELDPTADGSIMLFRRSDAGDDLWLATQIEPAQFAAAIPVTTLNSPSSDAQPFLQADGSAVYFSSNRTGNGDLYRASRDGVSFSTPALIDELSTPDLESDPVVSPDGLTLMFRSDRAATLGGANIYIATRASESDRFSAPTLVASVNSDADEGPSWLSPDGCRLYLWSTRYGTSDLFVATRGMK
jgi:Tol biopolymer transport system component